MKNQKEELTNAIENERKKADAARKERTLDAMGAMGSKIDRLIDGFLDDVDGGSDDVQDGDGASLSEAVDASSSSSSSSSSAGLGPLPPPLPMHVVSMSLTSSP
eukprot:CAMPEP_0197554836 /NCGR_PEP_ID=MMETSP1320-20131121/12138_1 /TAXON_ID=91990 /ORGANISM="Bolidomonas sp., Strain RCC2347" /LENGTH=103 /DNA_ID=CAMNT_0043115767 /DNA_START=393 /DNA_END=700 /DNA_ORIENTATION=+